MGVSPVLRWRAWLSISFVIVVAGWWIWSGGPKYVVRVDYQWLAGFADGAEVAIDDSVVGVLEFHPNRQPIQGFVVKPGEHVVELRARGCEAVPETVMVEGSRIHTIYADINDGMRCQVFFR